MTKIAYIFFGQVKNFDEKQYSAFQENVASKLGDFDVDYFLVTSKASFYSNARHAESEPGVSKIDYKSIEKYFDFKDVYYDQDARAGEDIDGLCESIIKFGEAWKEGDAFQSLKNSIKQIYSLEYFYDKFAHKIVDYDYFILSRSDLYHTHPLNVDCFSRDGDLFAPYYDICPQIDYGWFGGINDRFAVIKNESALKTYCTRYSSIKNNPEYYHAEQYLLKQLKTNNVNYGKIHNFMFLLNRASGKLSDFVGIQPDEKMNTNLKAISKSYFINLDRRTDRLHHMLINTPFFTERFSAVDSKQMQLTDEVKKLFPKTWQKRAKAEICCAISHYRLWKKLTQDKSASNYLILEDDVVFKGGFVKFWNEVFSKQIPQEYNLIYLGGCQPWNKPNYHKVLKRYNDYFFNIKKNDFFSEGDHFWHMTTCSYIISKTAASLMCQYVEQLGMDRALDFFMLRFFDENKFFSAPESVFHLNPLMTYQLHEEGGSIEIDKKSDIRNDQSVFEDINNEHYTKIDCLYAEAENNITKIIHQSWKTKDIPYSVYKKEWIDSWKKKNLDWEYKFWTDEDNRNLVEKYYPQYLELYDGYERPIAKADISRFFYMHKYGGLYVDLDFMCLNSMDQIIDGEKINLGRQKMKNELLAKNSVPNALIYSPPGDIFWIQCIEELKHHKHNQDGSLKGTEHATGPIFLGKCIDKFKPKNLLIHNETTFYPISWELDGSDYNNTINKEWFDSPQSQFPDSFAITYWSGGWRKNLKNNTKKMIILSDDLFEEDFVDELFGGVEYEKIFDAKMKTVEDCSIIVYSDMYARNVNIYPEKHRKFLRDRLVQLQQYFDKCKDCILVHLSDEHCHAEIDHYKNFKHVFRQYYRKDAVSDNVTFIPLGYKKGFKT